MVTERYPRGVRLGPVFLLVAVVLSAPSARANCARPVSYDARVTGNTVEIEPVNFENRACPDPSGMLREDVASGAIVRIAEQCSEKAYIDECVPPGKYRYGFGRAYVCAPSACSTDYFTEVEVTAPLAKTCLSRAKPEPAVPWGSGRSICSYGSRLAGCAGGVLFVLVLIGVLAAITIRRRRKRWPA